MHIQAPERTFYCLFNPGKRTESHFFFKKNSLLLCYQAIKNGSFSDLSNSFGEKNRSKTIQFITQAQKLCVTGISFLFSKVLISHEDSKNGITTNMSRGIKEFVW